MSIPHLSCCLLALGAAGLGAQELVSPQSRRDLEGSTYTTYPLGRYDARIQQLHADLGTGARSLLGHAYRRDAIELRGQVAAFQSELAVTLALSPRTADKPSARFDENLGAAPTLVLPRTRLSFPATDRPPLAPAPAFAHVIPYALPFAYPPGGGVLCVDVVVHGNQIGSGSNLNFVPYLDAHEQGGNGTSEQPGFRYGQGCLAAGQTTPVSAEFTLLQHAGVLDLLVQVQRGFATQASSTGIVVLLAGADPANAPLPPWPGCTLYTNLQTALVLGNTDATGAFVRTFFGLGPLVPRQVVHLQAAVARAPVAGLALSEGSRLPVPPPSPLVPEVVRIASGSDRTAATGTIATQVAVVRFLGT